MHCESTQVNGDQHGLRTFGFGMTGHNGRNIAIKVPIQESTWSLKLQDDWGEGEGGYVAIQAKYGLSDISTSQIDKFLSGSDNIDVFKGRVLVSSRNIAKNGEQKLEHATPRCQILRLDEIDSWVEDWRPLIPRRINELEIKFPKHELRPYQRDAVNAIAANFVEHDRGKLILPCGTGKSFVALKAAEQIAGVGTAVLYLVPSISLMNQTMREWSRHRTIEHQYVGICSDPTTGRDSDRQKESYALGQFSELCMPVTTEEEKITEALQKPVPQDKMRVVFSTYQSSPKVMGAMKAPSSQSFRFELAICDEAHRTTGIENTEDGSGASKTKPFQLIHEDSSIRVKKRLYMTATPRVFAENIRKRMQESSFDGQSYSMDDEAIYGDEAYRMSFADAIDGKWLSDYRVVVIGVSEEDYHRRAKQNPIRFFDKDGEETSKIVDAATVVRLAGSWDALATPDSQELRADRDLGELPDEGGLHARSAIAFTSRIKDSKTTEELWGRVADWHQSTGPSGNDDQRYLRLQVNHLDASTPSSKRNVLIEALRHADQSGKCQILTNVGVLSEGVDVPALDAIVFLQSRSSPVDVTQAVGRVMRRSEGKTFGYVVIPIVVPEFPVRASDQDVEHYLDVSDFKPVWDVVRALRSHDERIDHMLEARTMPIELRIPVGPIGGNGGGEGTSVKEYDLLDLAMPKMNEKFGSLMLDVCGDRHMYPGWGSRAGGACKQIELGLDTLIENDEHVKSEFNSFHKSLQKSVSPDITYDMTVRMVSQHLVTVPVFDELFGDSHFADRNPITQSMKTIQRTLETKGATFDREREPLTRAYRMMNNAFKEAKDPTKRLDVLRAIFDGFFREAMPDEVKTMGIAYTPIEVVDFMIRFVDLLCRQQFGYGLTARGVHILDPFVGTGTFLAHLLECKDSEGEYIIRDEDLSIKYTKEMHANELVLLAYYIAALKIEETKHRRSMAISKATEARFFPYEPFEHIVWGDTFHMSREIDKRRDLFGELEHNSLRAQDQLDAPIRVILGNPPWSSGKDDASESGSNVTYEKLSDRVSDTYSFASQEILKGRLGGNAGGNLFVKAFRWATDRIFANTQEEPCVIAFVSPNSLTDGTSLVGMRKVLREEFTDIYVVNLRGNAYKAGLERKIENDNVFGQSSRNGVQVTFLVRDPKKDQAKPAALHYAMVPEYSSLDEKFSWLKGICDPENESFVDVPVTPRHDWIDLQNPEYETLMEVCKPAKANNEEFVVKRHVSGVKTNLDVYAYDFSRTALEAKVRKLIGVFNACAEKLRSSGYNDEIFAELTGTSAIDRIKWTDTLKNSLRRGKVLQFDPSKIREVLYRPFTKCYLYEDWDILSAGKSAAQLFPQPTEQKYSEGGGAQYSSERHSNYHSLSSREKSSSTSDSQDEEVALSSSSNPSTSTVQSLTERDIRRKSLRRSAHDQSNEDLRDIPTLENPPPPPPQIRRSSSSPARPTKRYTDASQPTLDSTFAQLEQHSLAESSTDDPNEQRKQHGIRGAGDEYYARSSMYKRFATDSYDPLPSIVIASPSSTSSGAVYSSKKLCDLHLIAPTQASRIFRIF